MIHRPCTLLLLLLLLFYTDALCDWLGVNLVLQCSLDGSSYSCHIDAVIYIRNIMCYRDVVE